MEYSDMKHFDFVVVLYNSSGCELDRKGGDDIAEILRKYADDGCLSGGDKLIIIGDD